MKTGSNTEKELIKFYETEKTPSIFFICSKYRVSVQDAEDIFQKSILKALKNASKFRGDSSIRTWLYKITYNTFIDLNRSESRKKHTALIDRDGESLIENLPSLDPTPRCALLRKESISHLGEKIKNSKSKLSTSHQKAFELAFEKGLPYQKIASILKCSIGTVMSRVFYARKNFQKAFKRTC